MSQLPQDSSRETSDSALQTPDSGLRTEKTLWETSPTWRGQFGFFLLCALFCGLVIPIFIALARWRGHLDFLLLCALFGGLAIPIFIALARLATLRFIRYRLTNERLITTQGILNRQKGEIELYRIKDTSLRQSFFQRVLGVGDISIVSSDAATPEVILAGLADADELRESLRRAVEARRDTKAVREVDMRVSDLK